MDDGLPETDLEKAASLGDAERIQELVSDIDFDGTSEDAASALCAAAGHGHWDVVRSLVQDAKVGVTHDDSGGTVLQLAAVAGRLDIMKMLVAAGASISSSQVGSRVLLSSAATGKLDILRYAIDQGVDVAAYGGPAAWSAAKASSWECVRQVVSSGADLARDGLGVKLMSLAAVRGQSEVLDLLEQRGVAIQSEAGELALSSLASTQEWDVCADAVKYLMVHGVNAQTEAGIKALVTAAICGDLDVVRCIAERGVDVTSESAGEALSRAGELGEPGSTEAIVRYLTGLGAVVPKPPEFVIDEDF